MATVQYSARVSSIHKLRVNVKSLAAEARIIRKEERRAGSIYRTTLREHRIGRLRGEARHAQLALAFVRGKTYSQVEQSCRVAPSADRIAKKVGMDRGRIAAWLLGQ